MAVTREYAETESRSFLDAYDKMPPEHKLGYGSKRPDPMDLYERCFFCGQRDQDFRESKDEDCPRGCTIQPTIWEGA